MTTLSPGSSLDPHPEQLDEEQALHTHPFSNQAPIKSKYNLHIIETAGIPTWTGGYVSGVQSPFHSAQINPFPVWENKAFHELWCAGAPSHKQFTRCLKGILQEWPPLDIFRRGRWHQETTGNTSWNEKSWLLPNEKRNWKPGTDFCQDFHLPRQNSLSFLYRELQELCVERRRQQK